MTLRLAGIAHEHERSFDGWAAAHGVDPRRLPLRRFCNLVYYWATRNMDSESSIQKFDRKLWQPPKGVAPAPGSPWSAEAETSAFQALKSALGQ